MKPTDPVVPAMLSNVALAVFVGISDSCQLSARKRQASSPTPALRRPATVSSFWRVSPFVCAEPPDAPICLEQSAIIQSHTQGS